MLTPASSGQACTAGQRPSSASPASSGWTASGGLDDPSPASLTPATPSRPSSPASVVSYIATPLSGHPASSLATAICYLPSSQEVIAVERALERALLVIVAGRRTSVSRDEIAEALRSQCGLADGDFPVHRHAPEDFLVRFNDPSLLACVATTRVRTPRFRLIFHPWGRSAGSEPVKALFLVSLELFGVPDSTAETWLSVFRKIEYLAPETRDMSDMSVFKLAAWTINPDAIPRSSELLVHDDDAVDLVADPDRAERFALGLARFPVRIHVASCLDYRRPYSLPPPPPSAGDAGSGPNSPPFPPRWPQQHDFPPSGLHAASSPVAATSATHHRRAAFRLVSWGPTPAVSHLLTGSQHIKGRVLLSTPFFPDNGPAPKSHCLLQRPTRPLVCFPVGPKRLGTCVI
ncbi:hypothetical protein ZWY2020_040458 [Hordeum vulgare]|nr:hypothetical protein ZWY2020_040458 [Hordeum vulgare]